MKNKQKEVDYNEEFNSEEANVVMGVTDDFGCEFGHRFADNLIRMKRQNDPIFWVFTRGDLEELLGILIVGGLLVLVSYILHLLGVT